MNKQFAGVVAGVAGLMYSMIIRSSLFIAGVVVATMFCLPVSALPDFWVQDGSGRITHDCSEAQPLVICLQGRKVVMQVTAGGVTGVCYTARFYNVQQKQDLPLTKPILFEVGADSIPELRINDRILKIGIPCTATFDGRLSFIYPTNAGVVVTRTLYPSVTQALVIEEWQVKNSGSQPVSLAVALGCKTQAMDEKKDIAWSCPEVKKVSVKPGESISLAASVQVCETANPIPAINVATERAARLAVTEAAWHGAGRLETPDSVLNEAFALQKYHVLENPIETFEGVITHNGSLMYSPGIWANDPVEYSSPIFPFFGDAALNRASMNMYRVWQKYCQRKGIIPFPGAFWQETLQLGQEERGDDAMVLYGLSKFLLFQGDHSAAEELWPLIEFSAASVLRHTASHGVIASKTDEMEGRYPTGAANLSTSSLAYGGYRQSARLARALGKSVAAEFDARADTLRAAIENYFGAEVEGFKTYRYYDGNTTLRGWILLPLAMGITDRKEATVAALMSDKLWPNRKDGADILAESTRPTEWGRETYYALRVLFKAGYTEESLDLTRRVVKAQIFGKNGPYPDEDAIDMLCPGSLYLRVFTEGMFGMVPTSLNAFECTPWLPKAWPQMALRDIRVFGRAFDLVVEREGDGQKITVSSQGSIVMTDSGPAGKLYHVTFSNE